MFRTSTFLLSGHVKPSTSSPQPLDFSKIAREKTLSIFGPQRCRHFYTEYFSNHFWYMLPLYPLPLSLNTKDWIGFLWVFDWMAWSGSPFARWHLNQSWVHVGSVNVGWVLPWASSTVLMQLVIGLVPRQYCAYFGGWHVTSCYQWRMLRKTCFFCLFFTYCFFTYFLVEHIEV